MIQNAQKQKDANNAKELFFLQNHKITEMKICAF